MSQVPSSGWQPGRLEKTLWLAFVLAAAVYAILFGVSPLVFVPIVVGPVVVIYLLYRIATN